MSDDERAIRALMDAWFAATKAGDVPAVLSMMTDDVVFIVPGQEPFGKAAFAASFEGMAGSRIDGSYRIAELQLVGDWAFCRTHIDVSMTPRSGVTARRAGYTLTIFRRTSAGGWQLARDANLLTVRQ